MQGETASASALFTIVVGGLCAACCVVDCTPVSTNRETLVPDHSHKQQLLQSVPSGMPHGSLNPYCCVTAAGSWLFAACRGVDATPVTASGPPKTISVEDSFKGCSTWQGATQVLQVRHSALRCQFMESFTCTKI